MELDDAEVITYIDDMIAVLEDSKELGNRSEAKDAVIKLNEEIEVLKQMKENVKSLKALHENQLAYIQQKRDFQKRLIELYQACIVNVSPLLLQPHRSTTPIDDIYVNPLMIVVTEDTNKQAHRNESRKEDVVSSYKQIFEHNKQIAKLIYILGEAGTGKSVFCQKMIQDWCRAHSYIADELSDNVKLMKNYEFLLYISLRCNTDQDDIESMILNQYDDPLITNILENESDACLILLDGLDEWTPVKANRSISQFQTSKLPKRNMRRKYTVLTTSRPWKINSLSLRQHEVDIKFMLKGFDDKAVREFATKTVQELNKVFGLDKDHKCCIQAIYRCNVLDLKYIPYILHQMICLWYDGKLMDESRCDIYSSMLHLMFEWAVKDDSERDNVKKENMCTGDSSDFEMPSQLNKFQKHHEFQFVLSFACKMAFETLFSESKEQSLSFDKFVLKSIGISDFIVKNCISVGLLTEVRQMHLGASGGKASTYSFVHKSIQEFLAAVFVYNERKQKSNDALREKNDILRSVFDKCNNIDDILQNSLFFIMLCGFEPGLTPFINRYVYNIAQEDKDLKHMRNNIEVQSYLTSYFCFSLLSSYPPDWNIKCAIDLQNFAIDCLFEAQHNTKQRVIKDSDRQLCVADIICDKLGLNMNRWLVALGKDAVSLSVYDNFRSGVWNVISHVEGNLSSLVLDLKYVLDTEQHECILKALQSSTLTLKLFAWRYTNLYSLSSQFFITHETMLRSYLITKSIGTILSMKNLQALQLIELFLNENDTMTLISYLNKKNNLCQLSLRKVSNYYIDYSLLSYVHLNLLEFDFDSFYIFEFNVKNLHTVSIDISSYSELRSCFKCLKNAVKLKNLQLCGVDIEIPYFGEKKVVRQFEMLLKRLPELTDLSLKRFCFRKSILESPMDLKNLKTINLYEICFTGESWERTLVNILALPQNVQVFAMKLRTVHDGDDMTYMFCFHPKFEYLHNLQLNSFNAKFSTKTTYVGN